jgi:N-acetylmuramoyl-L-alanine amidase
MLVAAKGYKELYIGTSSFKEVSKGHWASGWIERAVQLGIFLGKEDGDFHP